MNGGAREDLRVKSAEFKYGCAALASLPAVSLPELAIVGRSNVGKSTLLNRLTSRKNLARTSSTPGRTQQLNYFEVALARAGGELRLFLVDLPGFGYAAVSKGTRQSLSRLIHGYLAERSALHAVCLLNDCRRMPEDDELEIRDLVFESGRHLLVVLTKIDKLSRRELQIETKKIAAAYGLEAGDLLLSGSKVPVQPIWQRAAMVLGVD